MSIQRADMEAGKIDFADVSSARCLPPIHPGEILQEDFIAPLGLSVYALAGALNVPRSRLSDIVRGRRAITTDTALRLARYFGTSPEFWLNLQASHDLDLANRTLRPIIEREVTPRAAQMGGMMSPDFIARGFQLDEPHVFLAWGLTEEELQALMGADLHRVTTGYYTASCMSLGGLRHKLGFHFKPRAKGTLQKLEFFQTSYVNYKTSFEEFQGHFEKIFGLPSNIYSGDGGMPSYEWKFPGVTISHFLLDRFGLEQHLWIEREFESNQPGAPFFHGRGIRGGMGNLGREMKWAVTVDSSDNAGKNAHCHRMPRLDS